MTAPPLILIVDDEPPNRRLLESILKREGYATESVENGQQALERVKAGGVDLVLLDVMMPVLDGVATCRAIREDLGLRLLPVVLVTALSDRSSRTRGKEAGADDFITKPIYQDELLARARVLLSVRRYQEELEVARRRLTGLLVHDLKNPLAAVRLNLVHVREECGDGQHDELREAAEEALQGVAQIQGMLLDLLDIGLAEDGQLPFAPAHRELTAVVSNAAARARRTVEERGAELRVDLPAALPALRFDEGLLVRVLQNLLGNAARYVPRGGRIEVQVRAGVDEVTLGVGNDGPRIAPEQQAHLFDKFGQVHEGQQAHNRGLGLYFCRLVAERHGGRIGVRDREGGGVCFELTLPLAPSTP